MNDKNDEKVIYCVGCEDSIAEYVYHDEELCKDCLIDRMLANDELYKIENKF